MNDQQINELEGIAVIGMAGRFPGARTVDKFWQNLCAGVESISFFSDKELIASGIEPALLRQPNYIKARGIVGDIDQLDPGFFGLNPGEAALADPQHRLFLECAWEAFESAGYSPDHHTGRVGVFAGESMNTYLLNNVLPYVTRVASAESLQAAIGNDKDGLTTEVAYRLNLTGPAVTIQSSSSTSLVAIHYACQSLLTYECSMALAGGVSLHCPEKAGYLYHEGGTTSSDGHCRAFDARAEGFVAGEGVGVVVLKRLEDALADGDTIYAVIKGSAVNNDGAKRVSYMAPGVDGQAEVVALAQAVAGVEPETIGYIETHGTATAMGDPIEIAALTQAFRLGTDKKGFCAIGSVKTNIGHLDTAAGVVGLIKTALALKHKQIPPSLHFQSPNPAIDFANSPFYVNTRLAEWPAGKTPRRAGVTSLGMGGTNAHFVLQEAPEIAPSSEPRPVNLLLFSAKTDTALEAMTDNLAEHLRQHPDLNLSDAAYTLQTGRRRFTHRRMLVCAAAGDAATALATRDPERIFSSWQESAKRPVMLMFSGQGAQYVNMGRELYETAPLFAQQVNTCAELLRPHLGFDLRGVLYPGEARAEAAALQLKQTAITQPALFVIEYALAKLWQSWGIEPHALIGHSIGEYVAACLAGVFSLQEALALVAARGQLMQKLPAGAMLAVSMTEEQIRPLLTGDLSLAAINAPSSCVVSGPGEAIERLQSRLAEQEINTRPLHTSHAFHSAMMEPILPAFREQVQKARPKPPTIPFVSNVTGTWIGEAEATDPDYWVRHLRQTVRFADGVQTLLQQSDAILLEVGPGKTLTTLAREHPARSAGHAVLSSLRHPREPQPDVSFLLNTIGRLWLAGVELDWPAFYAGERRQRLPLPTYPFERQRCWLEAKAVEARPASADHKLDVANWFYLPAWEPTLPPEPVAPAGGEEGTRWLLFADDPDADGADGLGAQLAQLLAQAGQQVVVASPGARFDRPAEGQLTLNPQAADDYDALFAELERLGHLPERIVHLWGVAPLDPAQPDAFETAQYRGFYSLLFLAQALDRRNVVSPLQITVITSQVHDVGGLEHVSPAKATVLGPCKVIPQEHPNLACRHVDVALPPAGGWQQARLVEQLLAECAAGGDGRAVVAYRGSQRWVQAFDAVQLDGDGSGKTRLRQKGVYLITGGLGNIGFVLAEALAQAVQARLVLVGRSALPARAEWAAWLAEHDEQDAISTRIRKAQALEAAGAEVWVASADVADQAQMQAVVAQTLRRFGALHGVIHAAGTVDESLFRASRDTGVAEAQAHFHTKAQALYVLEAVLQEQTLDFCLLVSSLAAVLGGLGLAAYSAANLFMDAFAGQHNRTSPTPWSSINWDAWQLDAAQEQRIAVGNPFAELAITAAEGADAFRRILSAEPAAQLVVSTSNLTARIVQWIGLGAVRDKKETAQADDATRHPRPHLQNAYVAPRNELEQTIAQVWQDILGIQQVGVYDNFFELGGNSLAGVRIIAQLREKFGVSIPAVSLYEGPTIHMLAQIITQLTTPEREAEAAYEAERSRGQRRRERIKQRRG